MTLPPPPTLPPLTFPTVTLEPTRCPTSGIGGWFEPSPGVWQDDYTFADKPGKQLKKISPVEYVAELKMIAGRDTLLFGIRGTDDSQADWNRSSIVIGGTSTGTTVEWLHFEFFLNGTRIYKDDERQPVFLNGPCGESQDFQASIDFLDSTVGLPPPGEKPFRIPEGPYVLEAKLVTEGGVRTGLKVTVTGESVVTDGPVTHFVPVIVCPQSAIRSQSLVDRTAAMATDFSDNVRENYPLPNRADALPTASHPLQDYSSLPDDVDEDGTLFLNRIVDPVNVMRDKRREVLTAAITSDLKAGAMLAGAERVVVVLENDQYDIIASGEAFAESTKLMIARWNAEHYDVAHEIVHTLPRHLWSASEMSSDCGLNYHNRGMRAAHGVRITYQGAEDREWLPPGAALHGRGGRDQHSAQPVDFPMHLLAPDRRPPREKGP